MPVPARSPLSAASTTVTKPASSPAPTPGRPWSIGELVAAVNRWCEEHDIAPASGQAAERLTERNVRYYRTRGLLDAPGGGGGGEGTSGARGGGEKDGRRGFTEKHAAQLRLIRLFQARGLPLEHIRDQLRGRSVEDLHAMERRELGQPELPLPAGVGPGAEAATATTVAHGGSVNGQGGGGPMTPVAAAVIGPGQEQWLVSSLGDDFLLVSRHGQAISDEQRRLIVALLRA